MTIESYVSAIVWLHVWQIAVLSVVVGAVNLVLGRRWPHAPHRDTVRWASMLPRGGGDWAGPRSGGRDGPPGPR